MLFLRKRFRLQSVFAGVLNDYAFSSLCRPVGWMGKCTQLSIVNVDQMGEYTQKVQRRKFRTANSVPGLDVK
jgi:hypothetical protein